MTPMLPPLKWERVALPMLPVPEVHEFPPQIGELLFEAERERFEQQFAKQQEAQHARR